MIVYKITNLFYGTSYIGQTVNTLRHRWLKHLSEATNKSKYPIHNAIRKYGPDAFDVEILCECNSKEEMDEIEKFCIILFDTKTPNGYNLTDGGEGWCGVRHSEESRRKISNAGKGRECKPETREKLRRIHKGRIFSEQSKRKMSEAAKGNTKGHATKGMKKPPHVVEASRKRAIGNKWNLGKKNALGYKHTEEARKRIRDAWKRRKNNKLCDPGQ